MSDALTFAPPRYEFILVNLLYVVLLIYFAKKFDHWVYFYSVCFYVQQSMDEMGDILEERPAGRF